MKDYLNDITFPGIYTFIKYEHHLKVSQISNVYKKFKKWS